MPRRDPVAGGVLRRGMDGASGEEMCRGAGALGGMRSQWLLRRWVLLLSRLPTLLLAIGAVGGARAVLPTSTLQLHELPQRLLISQPSHRAHLHAASKYLQRRKSTDLKGDGSLWRGVDIHRHKLEPRCLALRSCERRKGRCTPLAKIAFI